jgi:uncharacterized protein YndB with AHSA1/START domain
MEHEIRVQQATAASRVRVWEALIRPALWWSDEVLLEPEIGGAFLELWHDAAGDRRTLGKVTALEPPHRLELSWKDHDWSFETAVAIAIDVSSGDTALVTLRHYGWQGAPAADRQRLMDDHRAGWARHLKNLASCAEELAS